MSTTGLGLVCSCGCGVLVDVTGRPPAPLLPDLPAITPGLKWAPPPVVITPVFTPTQPPIMFAGARVDTPGCAANLGFAPWGMSWSGA